jgi:general secretion pathway protein A
MVLAYYKLQEHPFGVTPDSRYLFLGAAHREALASLLYGVEAGCGFVAMIAKPGLGKTTLLFHAMNQLREKAHTVFLFETVCTPLDLLQALLTGLGVCKPQGNLLQMQLMLKEILEEQFRAGKRVVVVIDEAQNLDDSVLELVRMLSNFETSREKLLQIILSGQPQLAEKIGSPQLEQLRQRVSIFARLKPLSREDTELYIDHRLRIAGYTLDVPLFTRDALGLIAECSDGIPRNINTLCFNSLALGCALQQKPINRDIVREVIADMDIEPFRKKGSVAAARPGDRVSRDVPAFLSAADAPSMLSGWVRKFALALVVLLALGGALLTSRRWQASKVAVHAEGVVTPPAADVPSADNAEQRSQPVGAPSQGVLVQPLTAAAPASPGTEQAPQSTSPVSTISVPPRRTLLGICVERFGRCNAETLQEIRRLNPGLSNLDHIEPGQQIHLPAKGAVTEQPGEASLVQGNTR